MNVALFLPGLACVVTAVVGGGATMAGVSIPPLRSWRQQGALAAIGLAVIGLSFVFAGGGGSPDGPSGAGGATSSPVVFPPGGSSGETAIQLSALEGPPGTPVQVSGTGFGPNETVEIRFHTEVLAETRTDGNGAFSDVGVRVPPDWRFKGQFDFVANGRQSIRSAREPFRVE